MNTDLFTKLAANPAYPRTFWEPLPTGLHRVALAARAEADPHGRQTEWLWKRLNKCRHATACRLLLLAGYEPNPLQYPFIPRTDEANCPQYQPLA